MSLFDVLFWSNTGCIRPPVPALLFGNAMSDKDGEKIHYQSTYAELIDAIIVFIIKPEMVKTGSNFKNLDRTIWFLLHN